MTVNATTSRMSYAGNGSTTSFPVSFKFLANGDLVVLLVNDATGAETPWTLGTQYTLSGAGNANGGTLTVSTSPSDYTPASGATLVIYRDPTRTQTASLPLGGPLPSTTLERMVDRNTMIAQRNYDLISRSLRQPDGDTTAMGTLPPAVERASKYLAFDADGDPIASEGPTGDSSIPVSAFIETLLDDADALTARVTLGLSSVGENIIQVISTDGGAASTNCGYDIVRASPTPEADDAIGALRFLGRNDAAVSANYGLIVGRIVDPTAVAHYGQLELRTYQNGVQTDELWIGGGIYTPNATGGAKGVDTINATSYYQAGHKLGSFYRASYEVTSGATGESYASGGWRKVTLNTESSDADGVGALSSNQITLAAGTWLIRATVIALGNSSSGGLARCRLFNTTQTELIAAGASANSAPANDGFRCSVEAVFVANGTDAIELDIYPSVTTQAQSALSTGANEVFAELTAQRIG